MDLLVFFLRPLSTLIRKKLQRQRRLQSQRPENKTRIADHVTNHRDKRLPILTWSWGWRFANKSSKKTKPKNIMGDKSPKAAQKKATQKQSKTSAADQKKQQSAAAKQVPKPKK